jgi:hypothetical protein
MSVGRRGPPLERFPPFRLHHHAICRARQKPTEKDSSRRFPTILVVWYLLPN